MNQQIKIGLPDALLRSSQCGGRQRDPEQSCAEGHGQCLAFDILVLDGFNLSEMGEVADCLSLLRELSHHIRVNVNLVSPQGGRCAGSLSSISVETERVADLSGPGAMILLGSMRAHDFGAELSRLWTQARRQGRHVIALGETVPVLKQRGCFKSDVVCVHWTDQILKEGRWAEEISNETIFHATTGYTTCAGRSSAVHAVLNFVEREFGRQMVNRLAEHLLLGDLRSMTAHQRLSVQERYSVDEPRLVRMLEIMENEMEDRLLIGSIPPRLGISNRQMERLSRLHLGVSPFRILEGIRMRKARWLVEKTATPIIEISIICGFSASAQFSKSFKRHFGFRPSELRRASQRPMKHHIALEHPRWQGWDVRRDGPETR